MERQRLKRSVTLRINGITANIRRLKSILAIGRCVKSVRTAFTGFGNTATISRYMISKTTNWTMVNWKPVPLSVAQMLLYGCIRSFTTAGTICQRLLTWRCAMRSMFPATCPPIRWSVPFTAASDSSLTSPPMTRIFPVTRPCSLASPAMITSVVIAASGANS